MRVCSICKKPGHNSRTCLEKGREIVQEQKLIQPREEIDGIKPKKGLWIYNPDKHKIAGKISHIKRDGTVVWENFFGAFIPSRQETFEKSGYKYGELQTYMLEWRVVK